MPRFALLLGGELVVTDRLRRQITGARVIAADSGMRHASALGCEVEAWVGDFDSATDGLIASHPSVPRQTYPRDKDATDGEIAIDLALARGATELLLVGALGGQTDHIFGNLAACLRLARQGVEVIASSGNEEVYPLIGGERRIDIPAGTRFSIVALTDLVGLTLSGTRWPLDQRNVVLGSSLTLSNEATGPVGVRIRSGHALAFAFDGTWSGPKTGR